MASPCACISIKYHFFFSFLGNFGYRPLVGSMNNEAPASFAGTIATTDKAAGKTTYAGPTRAEYEAMLDSTAPSPTFNQATSAANNHALTDARRDLQCVYDALIAKTTM